MKKKTVITTGMVVFCTLTLLYVLIPMFRRPSDGEIQRLQADGKRLVDSIEAYRTTHGAFPTALSETVNANAQTKWGGWEYGSDGTNFSLSVGNYPECYFRMHWQRGGQAWYVDK